MYRSPHSLYAAKAAGSNSCSQIGIYSGAISQGASQSRGPWLANGLCCTVRSSLDAIRQTRRHNKTLSDRVYRIFPVTSCQLPVCILKDERPTSNGKQTFNTKPR